MEAGLEAGVLLVEVCVFLFLCCFFTCFLVVGVVLLVLAGALEVLAGGTLGACAANVNGMAATASPIASKVFFMVPFLPGGPLCPLTISWCGRWPESTIACVGYECRRNETHHG